MSAEIVRRSNRRPRAPRAVPAPPPTVAPAAPRGRRRATTAAVIALFASISSLPFLALAMGLTSQSVRSSWTATVPPENRGAYIVTSSGAMQLFDWYIEPDDFPGDAPTLDPTAVERIAVVQKQHVDPASYRLVHLTTNTVVGWASSSLDGMQLTLVPPPLAPGDYELIVPTDDMFGGSTSDFFRLGPPDGGSGG
jgi:hypothetical protein